MGASFLQFEAVVFDDGVGQQLLAHLPDAPRRRLLVVRVQGQFHVLADADFADFAEAERVQGVLNGVALRVEHARFDRHVNGSFHRSVSFGG
jgi:hypothetical protein